MSNLRDSNLQSLYRLINQFVGGSPPDFVKQADEQVDRDVDALSVAFFADPSTRQFPLHTKSATWASALYLLGEHANGQPWTSDFPWEAAVARVEKAAAIHQIAGEVGALRAATTGPLLMKVASSEGLYALDVTHEGHRITRFPITTPDLVKESAGRLYAARDRYPYGWRKTAAINLLDAAATLNADIPETVLTYLVKASGFYPVKPEAAACLLLARAAAVNDQEYSSRLEKMAEVIMSQPDSFKVAELADVLNDSEQFPFRAPMSILQGWPLPEEMLFRGLQAKQASAEGSVALTTGSVYDLQAIKRSGLDPLNAISKDYMTAMVDGDQLNIEKAAEVLPTLPRDDARMLEQALAAVGVNPLIGLQKSAARMGDKGRDVGSMADWANFAERNADDGVQWAKFAISMKLKHPQVAQPAAALND